MTKLTDRLDTFAARSEMTQRGFPWEHVLTRLLATSLYDIKDRDPDIVAIRLAQRELRNKVSILSEFRGQIQLAVAARLSLSKDPERYLDRSISLYHKLYRRGFRRTPYLVLAAMELAKEDESRDDELIESTRAWFDSMRDVHPYLSAPDDYLYAALLARHGVSRKDAPAKYLDMERILSTESRGGNDMQTLTHVLMLASDDCVSLAERAREILASCHDHRLFLRFSGAMPLAGVLAMLPDDPDTLVRDLIEGEGYLREKRGFSDFSVPKGARLLIASQAMIAVRRDAVAAEQAMLDQFAIALMEAEQTALMCASVSIITNNNAG